MSKESESEFDKLWAEVESEEKEEKKEEQKPPEKKSEEKKQEQTSSSSDLFSGGKPVEEIPQMEAPEIPEPQVQVPVIPPEPQPISVDKTKMVAKVGEREFDLSPDKGTRKIVIVVYGLKGEGKTGLAFSFPGRIVCLSFDRKSVQVWEEMYKKDNRIIVFDAIRYLDKTTGTTWLKTSDETLKYVNLLLDEVIAPTNPDWIIIDGAEIFTTLTEMAMRNRNGLQPFQGIANRNLWKERRMLIDQIHNKCISIVGQGLIYTTYTEKDQIVKDGEFVTVKDVPKWIDVIMYATDVLIRVKSEHGKDGTKFYATVESSKIKKLPTGTSKDITDKGMKELFVQE